MHERMRTLSKGRLRSTLAGLLLSSAGAGERPAAAATHSSGVMVEYRIPAEAPTGEVEVLSLGLATLPVPSLVGVERFAHVRLAAVNRNDSQDWIVDARDQVLDLADGLMQRPRFAESNLGVAPALVILRRGERGYLDLFFSVPDDEHPPWIALGWHVRRGRGAMVATTIFERLPTVVSTYSHYRPAQYWGGDVFIGPSWCAPAWSSLGWYRHYAPYRGYRYSRRHDGFEVFDGGTWWRYGRGREADESEPRDTVGTHWRGRRPHWRSESEMDRKPHLAQPATERDDSDDRRSSWLTQVRRALPAPRASTAPPADASPGRSWADRAFQESPQPRFESQDSAAAAAPIAPSGGTVGGHWRSRR
jgi:hypothetical protein